MNLATAIDHLVVTAPNLKAGVEWVRNTLGATPELGGKHVRIGTHNCLLSLGEDTYLEVISPDPNAPDPGRPRWFELDKLHHASRPRLATWLVRTRNIHEAVSGCTEALGNVEMMSRGELNWLITVSADGSMLLDGVAPALIQWQSTVHPAQRMRDEGCRLLAIELYHPEPERVERMLQSIGLDSGRIVISSEPTRPPRIVARIETRQGVKNLS